MTVTLFSFVGMYISALDAVAHVLDKGAAFAAAQGLAEDDMLGWRLVDDMHPLAFQAAVVVNFSNSWTARAADLPVPGGIDFTTATLASLRQAISDARARLLALTAEQFDGRDAAELTVQLTDTMIPTLPAGRWLTGFATTNIHFHLSIAYAILRMKGVPLGKIDLFPGGL